MPHRRCPPAWHCNCAEDKQPCCWSPGAPQLHQDTWGSPSSTPSIPAGPASWPKPTAHDPQIFQTSSIAFPASQGHRTWYSHYQSCTKPRLVLLQVRSYSELLNHPTQQQLLQPPHGLLTPFLPLLFIHIRGRGCHSPSPPAILSCL